MDDFTEYERMKSEGIDVQTVSRYAAKKGLDEFAQIRMLREVFGLSLLRAKEIEVCQEFGVRSLTEYQEKLFPALKELFQNEQEDTAD